MSELGLLFKAVSIDFDVIEGKRVFFIIRFYYFEEVDIFHF